MSNWTTTNIDDLKASGHGLIVDKAQATAVGATAPVTEEIANAVARVRRAVATGNTLDANKAKVPNSLKGVTVRIVIFALMERIRFPLSDDQKKTREIDNSDLLRISDKKIKVESADDPDGTGEMQQSGGVDSVGVPSRQTGRDRQSGL